MIALLFTAISSACVAGNARAEDTGEPAGESGLRPLVTDLIRWIGDNSAYEVENYLETPPQISFCGQNEQIFYEDRTITMHEPVKGVYDLERAKITLTRPWSAQDPNNVGTLLHELIHFVQYSSRQWDCWHETEWEAYKLQEQWLEAQGIEPGFNWVEIFLLSRCARRDIHL